MSLSLLRSILVLHACRNACAQPCSGERVECGVGLSANPQEQDGGIQAFVLQDRGCISWQKYQHWLQTWLNMKGADRCSQID